VTEYINCIASLENLEEDILNSEEASEMRRAVSKLPPQEMELVLMLIVKTIKTRFYVF
jgi:DNA-directed RNA polymerase specialized sigma24 family protein